MHSALLLLRWWQRVALLQQRPFSPRVGFASLAGSAPHVAFVGEATRKGSGWVFGLRCQPLPRCDWAGNKKAAIPPTEAAAPNACPQFREVTQAIILILPTVDLGQSHKLVNA